MLEPDSRYQALPTRILDAGSGRPTVYLARRFLPDGRELPVIGDARIAVEDRLDRLSMRTLGDARQWWQIADANNCMDPAALTRDVGAVVRIPVPRFPD